MGFTKWTIYRTYVSTYTRTTVTSCSPIHFSDRLLAPRCGTQSEFQELRKQLQKTHGSKKMGIVDVRTPAIPTTT